MDRKTTFGVLVFLALFCAGLYVVTRPSSNGPGADVSIDAGVGERDVGHDSVDAGVTDASSPTSGFVDETAEGRAVRIVDADEPVAGAGVVAGAPGSYPPELGESADDGTFVVEHAATEAFGGERVGWVELYTFDGDRAAWSTVDLTDAKTPDIELQPGQVLDVSVVRLSGVPAAGATVRLSRDAVGLVILESIVDDAGRTEFGPIPPGDYVVTAEVPGFLTTVEQVSVVEGQKPRVLLEVSPGVRVSGEVKGADGRPVAGAVVALYVDSGDLEGVPRAIVATDAQGRFEEAGLPPGPTWAIASGQGVAPARSDQIDTREGADFLSIQLRSALNFGARVVTENDEPVRGATVSWVEEETGANGAALTDDAGLVAFDSVPPGAKLVADLRGWQSREHVMTADDAGKTVELQLTRGEPPKRLRLSGLPTDVSRIELVTARGISCGVDTIDERDFWVTGCPDTEATLEVTTESAGTATATFRLTDGATVSLPERRPLTVRVRVSEPDVVPSADWSDGRSWRRFDLKQVDDRAWNGTARLYPGTYLTRAEAPGHAPQEGTAALNADGFQQNVELQELVRHEAFILDVRRTPVTGARVEVWNGDRRVRVARSAGQLPVVVERSVGDDWFLVAIDPQRGERKVALEEARLEVELSQPVGTVDTPGRVTPQQLAERSDVSVARDGEAWLFDPVPGTPAAEVLARGDRYVTARSVGSEFEIVVERRGREQSVRLAR